jgi:hypothetical protein
MLETDNTEDTVALAADRRYYLVVDHTPVGSANGNDGNFNQISFSWYFTGIEDAEIGDGINSNPVIAAAPHTGPIVALVAVLATIVALL